MIPSTIDEQLARLAPTDAPDPARLDAARAAVMSRVTDPTAGSLPGHQEPARRSVRRLVPAAAAVVGLTAVLLLWPSSSPEMSAFATWVPTPAPVTLGDKAFQKNACTESIWRDERPATAASPDDLEPVVVERRGEWLYTLLVRGQRGAGKDVVYECLMPLEGSPVDWGQWAGNASAGAGATEAAWQGATGGGEWRSAWGYVGTEVHAVTITRWDGVELQATVTDGYFAAWWPGPERGGAEMEGFTVTWYLDDGRRGGSQEVPGS
ncbi:hypothetical protein [Actinotalea sp. C106]|uniref:hypothetical protein n=1 Tax=Actinotalea sp. C106 TaxID=2908644 RepID=UPI00202947EE|nr:hypothetical protein [Actinotalea sp. C106]